jgi:serine/threonine protein kinase
MDLQICCHTLQMFKILESVHSSALPVVHRDIKPENWVFNNGDTTSMLIDFGHGLHYKPEKNNMDCWDLFGVTA